jgi:leucine-rich PPR motif-containing protein, mitochondrial
LKNSLKIFNNFSFSLTVSSKERRSFNYNSTCWRLLNSIAEKGKTNELQSIFDALVKSNAIDATNVLLGPLVKVHLVNNDLTAAVNAFEAICQKHRSTPWKNELACRLIQAEDAGNLQRLTDLSTDIHGEVNSLYDLVFSFVECGRIRQARKILETPGLRTRPQRINSACERYLQEGLIQPLEGLMEATKDLSHIDRADIYQNLLKSYIKEKDPEKALGLWTRMQDEELSVTPSDSFLRTLGEFLKANNYEVPFVIPSQPEKPIAAAAAAPTAKRNKKPATETATVKTAETPPKPKPAATKPEPMATLSEPLQQMKRAIRSRDADQILAAQQKLTLNEKLNLTDQSIVIEALVKADRLNEATKMVKTLLENNTYPMPRIFRFYLNKVAQSGDVSTLESFEKGLDNETKKAVSFNNRLCHANIVAGKSEQYLTQLEADIMDVPATDLEKLKEVGEKFPRGGAAGILEQMPEMCDRFEQIAEKYAERGVLAPMNILWAHHFITKNDVEAQRIYDKYLVEAPRLMFQRIVQQAREKNDEQLIHRLVDLLKKSAQVSDGAIGNCYSCLLDIQSNKQEFDRALETLNLAIKDVCLENFNRTALLRIKDGMEKAGKQFPHKIPDRTVHTMGGGSNINDTTSSSSSSSSSSDEERPPKPVKK